MDQRVKKVRFVWDRDVILQMAVMVLGRRGEWLRINF